MSVPPPSKRVVSTPRKLAAASGKAKSGTTTKQTMNLPSGNPSNIFSFDVPAVIFGSPQGQQQHQQQQEQQRASAQPLLLSQMPRLQRSEPQLLRPQQPPPVSPSDSESSQAYNMSESTGSSVAGDDLDAQLEAQLSLLHISGDDGAVDAEDAAREARASPIFSAGLLDTPNPSSNGMSNGGRHSLTFCPPQYGLLASNKTFSCTNPGQDPREAAMKSRIFQNVAAPSSTFICGSQGSGKSHTLSCMLENCLLPSNQGCLPKPLAGVVFHYDTFTSDTKGSPCEAAYLASNPGVKVRVLCAPTNIATMKETYASIPRVTIEPLQLDEHDLNTQRMLDLMVANQGGLPLYLHVIQRILRDMRVQQQLARLQGVSGTGKFNYAQFKRKIEALELQPQQRVALDQRLDTLESFLVKEQTVAAIKGKRAVNVRKPGTQWDPKPGQLTIVDLSCPCVTKDQACSLFNICLSLFLEHSSATKGSAPVGKVIALDEAHKYMDQTSPDCRTLTEALLATIRLQRHLGARIIISTQEPTISPKLLDLCSVTIVHRFTSPDWLRMLSGHLAGISTSASVAIAMMDEANDELLRDASQATSQQSNIAGGDDAGRMGIRLNPSSANPAAELFAYIVKLKVGEALMFAPNGVIGVNTVPGEGGSGNVQAIALKRLGHEVLKVRMRKRLTTDGGASIMAH